MLLSSEETINKVQDKNYIYSKILEVLDHAHVESEKKKIRVYPDRLEFSCPICGDSANHNKKRGNFYFDSMWLVCFNEGCKSSFLKLCNDFYVDIDVKERLALYDLSNNKIIKRISANDVYDIGWTHSLNEIIKISNNNHYGSIKKLRKAEPGDIAYQYAKARNVSDYMMDYIYTCKYGTYNEDVIVILNARKDELLSLQVRNFKSGDKRYFRIYNWSGLNKEFNLNKTVLPDEEKHHNLVSSLFGIMHINPEYPINIFEGFFDSNILENSLALLGSTKDEAINYLLDAELNIKLFFDNDPVGNKKSKYWFDKGVSVFLWKKFIEKESLKTNDPFSAKKILSSFKDANELAQTFKKKSILKNLQEYFSSSIFDKLYL